MSKGKFERSVVMQPTRSGMTLRPYQRVLVDMLAQQAAQFDLSVVGTRAAAVASEGSDIGYCREAVVKRVFVK